MESRNLSRLPPFDKKSGALNIVVETPKKARIKYSTTKNTGCFNSTKPCPMGFLFRLNLVLCRRELVEMEIPWMCWFYPMSPRFLSRTGMCSSN